MSRCPKLVATSMAAITAAFLGSRLGTAGTVAGAGLASVVSTSAGAVYQHSIDRTRARFRPVGHPGAEPSEASEAAANPDTEPIPVSPARRWRPNWKVASGVAAVTFLVGMIAVTAVELVHGGPLSGGNTGTTVGSLFGQATEHRPPPAPGTTTPPPATTSTVPATASPGTTPPTTVPTGPTTTGTTGSPAPSTSQPSVTTDPTTTG